VIIGMQKAADLRGYAILLANTMGDPASEINYAKMVQTSQADGLIQLRAFNPFETAMDKPGKLLPMVNVCEVLDNINCPVVTLDNRAAAKVMTQYLIGQGHQHIALIKGPQFSPLTCQRLAGYRDALNDAGLVFDDALLYPGDFTLQSGYDAAKKILANQHRPTAVFCENDETAIGAMQCFKQAGLRIPQDISIAGFDDIAFSAFSDPPLTTIAQPAEEFGHTAVSMLIDLLEGKISEASKVIMPFELVVRGSTGPAPALPS
jgi:LacI family repressor for deo operon, udp, cdd, tsx, nupC, and nupG